MQLFSPNLSTLLKGGPTSKKDQVSQGHIQSGFEGLFQEKFFCQICLFSLFKVNKSWQQYLMPG